MGDSGAEVARFLGGTMSSVNRSAVSPEPPDPKKFRSVLWNLRAATAPRLVWTRNTVTHVVAAPQSQARWRPSRQPVSSTWATGCCATWARAAATGAVRAALTACSIGVRYRLKWGPIAIFGAIGYCPEFPLERMLRDARMFTIGGGTAQVQRNVIASHLLGRRATQRW